MLSKLRASDESFRRRMWRRIEDKNVMKDMTDADKKKIFVEMMKL